MTVVSVQCLVNVNTSTVFIMLFGSLSIASVLLLFWHAPLGVRSTIRRHQPQQRTVLSQIDCFVQCEVVGSQVSFDGVQPCDTGTPWWSVLKFVGLFNSSDTG